MNEKEINKFQPYSSIQLFSMNELDDLLNDVLVTNIDIHPRKIDKPIILYGAGCLGKMAKYFFDYLNIPYSYIIDKNPCQFQNDKVWQGIKILHPDQVNEFDKKNCLLIVCIVTIPLIQLKNELKSDKWDDIVFFYDVSEAYKDNYPLTNGWFINELDKNEINSIKKVFYSFKDKVSCFNYLQFLTWHKVRIELLFDDFKINNDNRFFIPEIINALSEDELFIDCGAHHGLVINKFITIVKQKYNKIYAFEPDDINFEKLSTNLKNISKVEIKKIALGNKNCQNKFYQGFDFASKLSINGNDNITVVTLDSLNIQTTFIKMHLEGEELNALNGAIKTIEKHRPILVVTLYHNNDGIWKIPQFIINNCIDYIFYMRIHSWAGTGAVFYAIPKERCVNTGVI
ncbi:MAG: FkbM family methyltransferase [Spirochaetota bacterium]|nr:FkbM family methyltransferase [Spirochaetota bacterium]